MRARSGLAFIPALRNKDKPELKKVAKELKELVARYQIRLFATLGTAKYLEEMGLNPFLVRKLREEGLDAIGLLKNKKIDLVINTFTGKKEMGEAFKIRRAAIDSNIYCITTIEACLAFIQAFEASRKNELKVYHLGEFGLDNGFSIC